MYRHEYPFSTAATDTHLIFQSSQPALSTVSVTRTAVACVIVSNTTVTNPSFMNF